MLKWFHIMRENRDKCSAPFIGVSRHRIVTDGDGVTTLVAFHGCNLHCKYCLNPQSLRKDGVRKRYSPSSLYAEVKKDNLYFNETKGGICFGGGEPLRYPNFIKEFKSLCPSSWRISVETSLNVLQQELVEVADVIDAYIIDIKDMNPAIYRAYTEGDNTLVKENLSWLISKGWAERITVRTPLIPDFNTQEDVDKSVSELETMGIHNFERLIYTKDKVTKKDYRVIGEVVGKATCRYLKSIRMDAANRHGIKYEPKDCTHKGPCAGTCPVCDSELRYIDKQIQRIDL